MTKAELFERCKKYMRYNMEDFEEYCNCDDYSLIKFYCTL